MYNLCQFAHSQEELDEWRERWRWREMKRQLAKQEGVYSYMQDLLEDYEAEDSGVNMVSIPIGLGKPRQYNRGSEVLSPVPLYKMYLYTVVLNIRND